jgi:hypothetical protein
MVAMGMRDENVNIFHVSHQPKLEYAVANTLSAIEQEQALFRLKIGARIVRVHVECRANP